MVDLNPFQSQLFREDYLLSLPSTDISVNLCLVQPNSHNFDTVDLTQTVFMVSTLSQTPTVAPSYFLGEFILLVD